MSSSYEPAKIESNPPLVRWMRSTVRSACCVMFAALSVQCSLPPVNLSTPEPIKVDVNVRLDVYQYRGDEPTKKDAAKVAYEEAVDRQRNRMGEIQTLKNNGLVGEEHRGLLYLREKPNGEWGEYTERTVKAENEDRITLMRYMAKESNRALHEVQREQWELRVARAFEGEWVEVTGDKPNSFVWKKASKSMALNRTLSQPLGSN